MPYSSDDISKLSQATDVSLNNPADNDVLAYNAASQIWQNKTVASSHVVVDRALLVKGSATINDNILPPGILFVGMTILTRLDLHVSTAPVGASLTVRLRQNSITLGTVTVSAGATYGFTTIANAAITSAVPVLFDITSVGSSTAGADVMLTITTISS